MILDERGRACYRFSVAHRQHDGGWTAIEVSLVISVIGVALCMFVPAFLDRLELSKFTRMEHELDALTRAVASYYAAPHEVRGATRTRCLPASAGPTPAEVGPDPTAADFQSPETPGSTTWTALGFQPSRPGRFQYRVEVSHARCSVQAAAGTTLVRVEARADLDGDGQLSSFRRELVVGQDGTLVDGPLLRVRNRTE
ncbi:MAG: hypothetical protein R3B40_01730 [Polyangiales bacterium]